MNKTSETVRKVVLTQKLNKYLDLNTDFGQSSDRAFFEGKERSLLHYVSSVNIPCCVHDSDPPQVLRDIQQAKANNCAVGAHIAYPDPRHFGYDVMDIDHESLYAWILLQLGAFSALCRSTGIDLEHVRPHGALYSQFLTDEAVAMTVARAVCKFDPWAIMILPVGSPVERIQAELTVQVAQEVYLGKRVSANGSLLVDRFQESLHPQGVIEQVKQLVADGSVTTEDGKVVKVQCKTMHLSPKLQGNMMVAERITAILGQPVSLSLAAAGSSGWL